MSRPDGYLLPENEPDVEAIIEEVARGFRLTSGDILSDSRQPRIAVARACAMAVVRETTGLSYPVIGEAFGRAHSTVMQQVRKVMDDPDLRRGVELVVEELSPPPRLFALEDIPPVQEAV